MQQLLLTDAQLMIRFGVVTAVDPAAHTARVQFYQDADSVSYDLPVAAFNTFSNRDYALPDVGEDVMVIAPVGAPEDGIIMGSFYAGEVVPPAADQDIRMTEFSDGTTISYNRATHTLTAVLEGTEITATRDNASLVVPSGRSVNCDVYSLDAGTSISLTAGSSYTVTCGGSALSIDGSSIAATTTAFTVTAPTITLAGSVAISGSITQSAGGDGAGTASFDSAATFTSVTTDTLSATSITASTVSASTSVTAPNL